jgi:hypothetical protein
LCEYCALDQHASLGACSSPRCVKNGVSNPRNNTRGSGSLRIIVAEVSLHIASLALRYQYSTRKPSSVPFYTDYTVPTRRLHRIERRPRAVCWPRVHSFLRSAPMPAAASTPGAPGRPAWELACQHRCFRFSTGHCALTSSAVAPLWRWSAAR